MNVNFIHNLTSNVTPEKFFEMSRVHLDIDYSQICTSMLLFLQRLPCVCVRVFESVEHVTTALGMFPCSEQIDPITSFIRLFRAMGTGNQQRHISSS